MTTRTYESAADTARKIRKALKREFPGIKFSVRTSNYSMGSSIRVGALRPPIHGGPFPLPSARHGP